MLKNAKFWKINVWRWCWFTLFHFFAALGPHKHARAFALAVRHPFFFKMPHVHPAPGVQQSMVAKWISICLTHSSFLGLPCFQPQNEVQMKTVLLWQQPWTSSVPSLCAGGTIAWHVCTDMNTVDLQDILCNLSGCLSSFNGIYIDLSMDLPIYLYFYLSTYLSIYLCICLPTDLFSYLSTYLPIYSSSYLYLSNSNLIFS